jgi:hypothetical protein
MGERRCRYCERAFQISKYQPRQVVCNAAACQQRRRSEYRQQKLAADAEYRQVCTDSSRKWRARHAEYWKRYREQHPESVLRNREQQHTRDQKRRLLQLANSTSALDLKHSAARIWLLGAGAEDLANNNSVPAQVWVIETLPRRLGAAREACQQQPAGATARFAG